MQPPVLYSSEIMSSVTHRSVGVQCDIAELKTAGAQTDENDDAGDSFVITCSVADRSVSVQCDTAERKTARAQTDENEDDTMALRRLSIGIPGDQAAGGAITPTTDTKVAERRVSDEAGTDPPESDASGSEKEIRMGPTALIHHVDSSPEAQSHCSAVGHETGYDEEVTAITDQVGSAVESEQEAGCGGNEDAPPMGIDGLPETTHTDVAASDEGSEAETSDGDSECDEPYWPDLDIVFDVIGELAGADGRDWVPVRQIQAQTSLSLGRLEDLLDEWEFMGVIRWDDTRSEVALCLSAAEALMDDCRAQIEKGSHNFEELLVWNDTEKTSTVRRKNDTND